MWETFLTVITVEQALELLAKHAQDARIINGGTALMVEIDRRMRSPKVVIDISHPTREEIQQALSGHLCRCTGYGRIVEAIERAANSKGDD